MKTLARSCIALLALALAGAASARTDIPWDGFYFGGNVGDALTSSCDGWALSGAALDPPIASQDCSKSGKQGPRGFVVIGPRTGYARDTWLPYGRVGTIIAQGAHDSTLFYTPTAGTKPTASFGAGFSGISFDNTHEGVSANLFRVGVTYRFGYC